MWRDPELGLRVALAAMIVGAAAIGIPHRLRADRAGGRVSTQVDPRWFWIGMAVIGPPVVLVVLGFLIEPRWVAFAQLNVPNGVRGLGGPVGVAGLALFAWMFRHLALNVTSTSMPRQEATLITSGPYRWMRHPMYTAALVLGFAATLLTANLVMLVGGLAMFALLAARSVTEEQRLVRKFGDAYRDYQRRTGRFFPGTARGRRVRR